MKKEKKMDEQEKNENSSMEQPVESHNSDQTTEVAQEEQTAEEKIAELEKQIADLNDKYIRTVAENDNWRKRMIQQKDEAVAYANASLLGDLLESLDNFDRTVEAAEIATDAKSIADGVKMINKSLVSMLETKYNLVGYGAKGDAFDPDIHEAIGKAEGDVKVPELQEVYLKGYKLKERVIRHAKVMVLMPKE